MTFKNLAAAIDKAVSEGVDQTVAKTGGAGPTPPAAGPCNLRLVGYIEVGKHKKDFKGKPKVEDQVVVTFEVSGRNHPPIETDNGTFPHLISETLNLSLNEKARFFKLFQILNYQGKAKHMAQLLGASFRGTIIHRTYKKRDGSDGIAAELYDKALGAYTIRAPRVEVVDEDDQPTGEFREVKVAEPLSPLRCFLWNYADMEQWASLFIDGEYEERKNDKGDVIAPARSKNRFQLSIRAAENYKGSPIQQILANGGAELELPADGVVEEETADEGDDTPSPQVQQATPRTQANKPRASAKGDPLAGVA